MIRFIIARTGFATALAAAVLTGCGAGGTGSSQNVVPAESIAAGALRPAASACADKQLAWYFHGSCARTPLKSKGGSVTLKSYHGIGFQATIGSNTVTGKVVIIVGDATGAGDITGATAFPPYGIKTCFSGFKCPGRPLIYAVIANPSTQVINLTGTTTLSATAKKFPGKRCNLAALATTGETAWSPVKDGAAPKSGKVSVTIPMGVQFPPGGAAYVAIVCT